MRSWHEGAIMLLAVASTTAVAGTALGCPPGLDRPVVRPVRDRTSEAEELFERARRLESAASSQDARARTLEQEAGELSARARSLRREAALATASDRRSLLLVADEVEQSAVAILRRASEQRARASELRLEAQALRQRAVVLARGGGGWRPRPNRVPTANVPVPPDAVSL